ncbi:CAMK/CAMK1 protein kinase, variant 1 [Aphanomyces astaci]|uniref:CAMK/CAMK1 protein kinase, variant 1 n=1 Tax=Aphanomyces astaci TaxID=112090 RepID=W4GJ44_APHAT|nr:CAMK/CAMK1 protein kinase, variant 1 [Aphanomyces astaci]ETV79702.1 CAMK/CAMK1 protein kinase, variant 1 [Aphanomyces astaci]|eukprot:XP_009830638.1 CAMK/CAMK1 protein kinase, variant 1 [Aphanomyces astaci]
MTIAIKSSMATTSSTPPAVMTKAERIASLIAECTMFEVDPCSDHYVMGRVIGSGAFSIVRVATQKQTQLKVAAKCIKKAMLDVHEVQAFIMEASVLKEMNHPNVIKLHAVYSEPDMFILITEFVEGGELFDRIVDKTFYTEREARDVVKGLLHVTAYCHAANIVHRDLKPENILLVHRDDDASFKLADFGFAQRIDLSKSHLVTQCGTPGYVAPEVLRGKAYGNGVDIWSIGVITYILLCGYPPFHNDNRNALFQQVKSGTFEFHSPYWDHISDAAKDFIRLMLTVDPNIRYIVPWQRCHVFDMMCAQTCGKDAAEAPMDRWTECRQRAVGSSAPTTAPVQRPSTTQSRQHRGTLSGYGK